MVDDEDGERGFLRDELEAGVLRAEDAGGALIVGADGALRDAGEAEGDVVDAGEAGLVDEQLSWKVFMTKARNCGMVVPEN